MELCKSSYQDVRYCEADVAPAGFNGQFEAIVIDRRVTAEFLKRARKLPDHVPQYSRPAPP